jgi:hypothetical protein
MTLLERAERRAAPQPVPLGTAVRATDPSARKVSG